LAATFVEDGGDTRDGDEMSGAVSGARSNLGKQVRLTTTATVLDGQAAVRGHTDARPGAGKLSRRSVRVPRPGFRSFR